MDLSLAIDADVAAQLQARLDAQTVRSASCWRWTGYRRNSLGHGAMSIHNRPVWVHRIAYALAIGPVPADAVVCHSCDVPPCIRPDHLFLGTQADNVADMERKGRARKVGVAGPAHHHFRITDDVVKDVRAVHAAERPQQRELARRFGLTQASVWAIVNRRGRFAEIASAIASLMGKIELHANTWSAHAEVLESALSAAAATSGDVTVAAVRAGATRSRRDYGSSGGRAEQSTEREVRGETSPSPSPARTSDGTGGAPKRYLQKILDALASLEAIGYARATNLQVATWSKMSVRGGAFGGYVRELVAARMVERDGTDRAGQLWLTPAGRDASRAHDLATSDLHAMAHAVAKGYLHKVLDPLLEVYPVELSLQDLALRAGMSIEGGAFMGYVRELRALGFVVSTKDTARAADALFLEAVR